MLLHLVYNTGLEVAAEDVRLFPLKLDELYGIAVKMSVQLGHDNCSSTALILGGVTACAAQMMETRIERWHFKTNSAQLMVYLPIHAWTSYFWATFTVVFITM